MEFLSKELSNLFYDHLSQHNEVWKKSRTVRVIAFEATNLTTCKKLLVVNANVNYIKIYS
jgi:hypothetical protein